MAANVRLESRPFDRAFAFPDPLLRHGALVVEGYNALSRPGQIGNDKADTRVKLTGVQFDLGQDAALLVRALRLIVEANVVAAHLFRRSPGRALQQIADPTLRDVVGRQPDRIADALGLEN